MAPGASSGRTLLGKVNELVVSAFTMDQQRTSGSAHFPLLGVPPVLYNLRHLVGIADGRDSEHLEAFLQSKMGTVENVSLFLAVALSALPNALDIRVRIVVRILHMFLIRSPVYRGCSYLRVVRFLFNVIAVFRSIRTTLLLACLSNARTDASRCSLK